MGIFNWKKKKKESFDDFPEIGGLIISKIVIDQGILPLFMFREKRSNPNDSGWRVFSGLESDEYSKDPNNFAIYSASTLLKIDSSVSSLLLKGGGSVYEKLDYISDWNLVKDYELEDDFMVTHDLTNKWELKINNLFERVQEGSGEVLYTTGDKSLRVAVWNEQGESRDNIFDKRKKEFEVRDQSKSNTLETIDLSDENINRIGYIVKENDGNNEHFVLFAVSIIDEQLLNLAFYFDDILDKDWAIDTWKKIVLK